MMRLALPFLLFLIFPSIVSSGQIRTNAASLQALIQCNDDASDAIRPQVGSFVVTNQGGATVVSSTKCRFGRCVLLDGVNDDFLMDGPAWDNTAQSVVVFVNPQVIAVQQIHMAEENGRWAVQMLASGQITFQSALFGGSNNMITSTASLSVNRQYMITTTFKSTTNVVNECRIYINDKLDSTGFCTGTFNGDGGIYLGGFASQFNGYIGPIAFFSKALTEAEVKAIYQSAFNIPQDGSQ